MSKITVAESAGFCFGVDRAVKMVYSEIEKHKKVATLGPIIHNQDVVNDMLSKGIRIVNDVSELEKDETVVIRSHGVGRDVYQQIEKSGNEVIDATCPFVSRIHKLVAEKTAEGYFILIAGDENHAEVIGIVGHCDENYLVFRDETELKNFFQKKSSKKLAIVAQTTYNIIVWEKCFNVIPKDDPDIVIYDTICNATETRQSDAERLALEADLMIVVGGKHSSNTVKLYDVCSKYCETHHIENGAELLNLNLPDAELIGITAGASTPAYIIKEVQTIMSDIQKNFEEEMNFEELLEQSFKKIHTGERVTAYVDKVTDAEITVSLGTKHTGYVKLDDLTDDPTKKPSDIVSVGDEIDLIVIKVNDAEGTVILSKRKIDELAGFEKVVNAKEEGTVLEGVVQHVVKGGVTLNCYGLKIFIPASQSGVPKGGDLEVLLKKKVKFKIIEASENGKRFIGSIRAAFTAEKEEAKAKFWAVANVGDVFKGKVKSITNFGVFVDLGGIDGMVHVTELSWKKIRNPRDVVSVGDILEVYIKELCQEDNRISLGYRKTEDDPLTLFMANNSVGDIVNATIVSIAAFGAFARLAEGVDGLIHISQISFNKVNDISKHLTVGQDVAVKILGIDTDTRRVSISIRAALEEASNKAGESDEVVYSDEQ